MRLRASVAGLVLIGCGAVELDSASVCSEIEGLEGRRVALAFTAVPEALVAVQWNLAFDDPPCTVGGGWYVPAVSCPLGPVALMPPYGEPGLDGNRPFIAWDHPLVCYGGRGTQPTTPMCFPRSCITASSRIVSVEGTVQRLPASYSPRPIPAPAFIIDSDEVVIPAP